MRHLTFALLALLASGSASYGQSAADSAKPSIGTSGCGIYPFRGLPGFGCFDGTSPLPKSVPIAGEVLPLRDASVLSLQKWRGALARVRAGTGFARIVFFGDSTTGGANCGSATNLFRPTAPPVLFANLLNKDLPTISTSFFGTSTPNQSDALNNWDNRLSYNGSFATGVVSLGGYDAAATNTSILNFAPNATVDTVDVYYLGSPNGPFKITTDGGNTFTQVTPSSAGTAAPQKVTVTFAAKNPTIGIYVPGTGGTQIVGMDAYLSTQPSVHVYNAGWGGARAGDVLGSGNLFDPIAVLNFLQPDLVVINFGINDWVKGTPLATFAANYATLVNAVRQSGTDVALVSPIPSDNSVSLVQGSYVAAIESYAFANNLAFIPLYERMVSKTVMIGAGYGNDLYHANANGCQDMSLMYYEALHLP